jgi:hypothetical protein
MRANTASALLVFIMLAAPAIGEDVTAVQPPLAPPAVVEPPPLPPAEPPVEVISPAQAAGDAVTFDTMESIPFENAVEPPDEPAPLDNAVKAPGLDNAVPGAPAAAGVPPAPAAPPAPGAVPAPPPPANLIAQ